MTTAHLALMSKPRLIAIIAAAEKRAQQHAELADYWRNVTNGLIDTAPKPAFTPSPETTLAEARRILRGLPIDPHAQEHRDTLLAEVGPGYGLKRMEKLPGERCAKGCDKRINEFGFCPRCQSPQTKRARTAAAA